MSTPRTNAVPWTIAVPSRPRTDIAPSYVAGVAVLHACDENGAGLGTRVVELGVQQFASPDDATPPGVHVGVERVFVPATGDAGAFLRRLVAEIERGQGYAGWSNL